MKAPIPFMKLDSRVIAIQGNHDTAVEASDGSVTYSQLPRHRFTREIPLKPIRA